MKRHHTRTRLSVAFALAVVAVSGVGTSSSDAARAPWPTPRPGCNVELKSFGRVDVPGTQLYRWTVCGRGVGLPFG